LRDALELVRDAADEAFEKLGAQEFDDPWAARDNYIDVLTGRCSFDQFLDDAGGGSDPAVARTLLEIQESSLSMFTSCAWFFSDVSGIETVQIMRYAERTMRLLELLGAPAPREDYLARLTEARSNVVEEGNGADIHLRMVKTLGI
jgi:alpha-amylase/alpha-mannosidase (GH57 family)